MRILFVRHCEPDYEIDSLTPRGFEEAERLREYLKDRDLGDIYVSPLGRARKTAEIVLQDRISEAVTMPWLREFDVDIDFEKDNEMRKIYSDIPEGIKTCRRGFWDIFPECFWQDPLMMDNDSWRQSRICAASNMAQLYDSVTSGFDRLLEEHGYRREGKIYRAVRANHGTITLFCHLGVTSILLAHLNNLSPFIFPQFTCPAPSALTEVVTEERQQGIAMFRTLYLGATPHLTLAGEEPSFSARFAECYEDKERH
ncbi:MAG: phosphoglycerate mutase family protein [Erysipelotrichaceae bacterium]|nr:phosphoglycerate mutase family protein [Erysipelotrichaceae bacterium]